MTEGVDEVEIGRVNDYFAHISVAGIDLSAPLKVGDRIRIKGHTTDIEQAADRLKPVLRGLLATDQVSVPKGLRRRKRERTKETTEIASAPRSAGKKPS